MQTTVVGAWPKPDYLDLPDWFSNKGNFEEGEASKLTGMGGGYDPRWATAIPNIIRSIMKARDENPEELDKAIDKAVKEVIDEQLDLGIDVVTDGEMNRGSYYIHIMTNIKGIDMVNLAEKTMRSGAYTTFVPVVTDKVYVDEPRCWKEWKRSNDIAPPGTKLKYTIPGPMTLTDGTTNVFYKDNSELQGDLVKAVNKEILALVEHGCRFIQIDEPVLMRYPEKALDYGIANLDKCFANVPDDVTKVVHLCCGYPDRMDTDEYPKANKENYRKLAPLLDAAVNIDEVSLEDAEAQLDLSLLSLFKKTKVILGSVTVARSRVESVQQIVDRVKLALQYIPRERLILAPDCGLGFLPKNLIREKLANMVAAARKINALQ